MDSDEESGRKGSAEAHPVDVGEATEVDPRERERAARAEKPDLDARQRNMSTSRRPMGPPPRSDEKRAGPSGSQEENIEQEENVEPTDLDTGER